MPGEPFAEKIGGYILDEFLPGEARESLTASTPLISSGILDSIALLRLVTFLEDAFAVRIAPAEVDVDHFETIERMTELIRAKQSGK